MILAKRPRSDTEASLPREGAPGFPSLEYGGQYAVPESRSLEPTVAGRYEHVADIDALVLQQKRHKTSSKAPNTSPALIVIKHPFLLQNEVISFLAFVTETALQTQTASKGCVVIIRSARACNLQRYQKTPAKRLPVRIITLLCFGEPFKRLNFQPFPLSTTIPQGKHRFSSDHRS